jgi:ribosomal protein S5
VSATIVVAGEPATRDHVRAALEVAGFADVVPLPLDSDEHEAMLAATADASAGVEDRAAIALAPYGWHVGGVIDATS